MEANLARKTELQELCEAQKEAAASEREKNVDLTNNLDKLKNDFN